VLLSTAEDPLAQVVVPRLRAAEAVESRIQFVTIERDGFHTPPLLPGDVHELGAHLQEVNARLLVLDPLMAHLGPQVNSWKDQEIRSAIGPLQRLAEQTGAAVVVVAHLNKGQSSDPLQRLGGSIGLPAAARSVLLLGRDPDDPDGADGDRRVLAQVKSNLGPIAASLCLRIEPVETGGLAVGPIIEAGYSHYSGVDLLAVHQQGRPSKQAQAIELLQQQLAGGPKPVSMMQQAAAAIGISETTLERAKKALALTATKGSFNGGWLWALPQQQANHLEELPAP
jgi:hypothetical protein